MLNDVELVPYYFILVLYWFYHIGLHNSTRILCGSQCPGSRGFDRRGSTGQRRPGGGPCPNGC